MNRENTNCKIFVGGLSQLTNDPSLREYFEQFGDVSNVHIKRDENMRSKGYGVVTFTNADAVKSVLETSEHYLDGNRIDPKRFNFDAYTSGTPEDDNCKMFIGGLGPTTTEVDLRTYFSEYGNVRTVLLKKDIITGNSRGFAFVTFDSETAVNAVLKDPLHVINGKSVDAKAFKGKPGKIFIGGISRDCTMDELREYFEQFGTITEQNMPMDHNNPGKNKGFCFITYESETSVRNCLMKDAHPIIQGRAVEVKKAVPQEEAGAGASGGFGGPLRSPRGGARARGAPQAVPGGAPGCPYCGGSGPVINPPRLWPMAQAVPQQAVPMVQAGLGLANGMAAVGNEMYDDSYGMNAGMGISQQQQGYGYGAGQAGPVMGFGAGFGQAGARGRGRGFAATRGGFRTKPY